MAVSGCANCLRVLTIIFNFVVFLCGILLVAFASYVLHQFNTVFYGLKAQEYGVVIGLLVLGLLIFFLGFLGCCGAWKESICMLTTFATIIGILLVVQVIVAIVGFVYKDEIPKIAKEYLDRALEEAKSQGGSPIMQEIERTFHCCGVSGPLDYGAKLPESCGTSSVGCAQLAEDYIRGHSTTLFIVAIVVALLQLAAVIVACCLQSNIRKYQTV
nr:unnamed protein product [Spirometra erinaceieuropaei]